MIRLSFTSLHSIFKKLKYHGLLKLGKIFIELPELQYEFSWFWYTTWKLILHILAKFIFTDMKSLSIKCKEIWASFAEIS